MVTLYSRPLIITYRANKFSCAFCWTVLYVLALIVLPYIVAYALGGLWTKELLVREQPSAGFRFEALVEAYGTAGDDRSILKSWAWSTSVELNDALGSRLRPCDLQAWEEDDELDGVPDRLQFVLRMPLDAAQNERLHSISVVLGVDVEFSHDIQLRMNSSLHLEASSPLPGRTWNQTADLDLRTRLPHGGSVSSRTSSRAHATTWNTDIARREPCPYPTWAFQQPVLPSGAAATAADVLAQYASCNDTAVLLAQPPLWTPGVGDAFDATITLRVPSQLTSRTPGLFEALKLAFVQYIAMLIPIGALLTCLHGALFRTGVLAARMHHPIKQHHF